MPSPRVRTTFASLLVNRSSPANRKRPACAAAFSTTSSFFYAAGREPNHYEILDVPVTATAAEIKKSFYALSLRHHPDRNRNDPNATSRFSRISAAYNVLGNSAKRAAYDRDSGIHAQMNSTHSTANPGQHPMGSYSSHSANVHNKGASYAGSRPASGLSKRRGTFRGPPPSFYAHGGYGTSKRPPPGASSSTFKAAGGSAKSGEEDPTSFIDRNAVHHFNARGHFRTQSAEDARRRARQTRESASVVDRELIGGGNLVLRFIVVCGILAGCGAMAGLFHSPSDQSGKASKPVQRRRESS